MTIDELMEGKQPGEIKVISAYWSDGIEWFMPYFKAEGYWHGIESTGSASTAYKDTVNHYELWQEPKKKVVRYLWVNKVTKFVSNRVLSKEEAISHCEDEFPDWRCLEYSATEMDE